MIVLRFDGLDGLPCDRFVTDDEDGAVGRSRSIGGTVAASMPSIWSMGGVSIRSTMPRRRSCRAMPSTESAGW